MHQTRGGIVRQTAIDINHQHVNARADFKKERYEINKVHLKLERISALINKTTHTIYSDFYLMP